MIYLDTHLVAWLYLPRLGLLSKSARRFIEKEELLVSPMVLLELDFLQEIGRLSVRGHEIYENLHGRIELRLCGHPFPQVIEQASTLSWLRDPFDRIIVAQAAVGGNTLLTRDERILDGYAHARW